MDSNTIANIGLGVSAVILVGSLIASIVLTLISKMCLFKKYGEEGWKGIIPFYSTYIEGEHVWTGAMALLSEIIALVPQLINIYNTDSIAILSIITSVCAIAGLVLTIMMCNKKSKAFGKGIGMTIVLWILPFIGNLYLAFSDAQYEGNKS